MSCILQTCPLLKLFVKNQSLFWRYHCGMNGVFIKCMHDNNIRKNNVFIGLSISHLNLLSHIQRPSFFFFPAHCPCLAYLARRPSMANWRACDRKSRVGWSVWLQQAARQERGGREAERQEFSAKSGNKNLTSISNELMVLKLSLKIVYLFLLSLERNCYNYLMY